MRPCPGVSSIADLLPGFFKELANEGVPNPPTTTIGSRWKLMFMELEIAPEFVAETSRTELPAQLAVNPRTRILGSCIATRRLSPPPPPPPPLPNPPNDKACRRGSHKARHEHPYGAFQRQEEVPDPPFLHDLPQDAKGPPEGLAATRIASRMGRRYLQH